MYFVSLSHPRKKKTFGVHHKGRVRLKARELKLAGYLFYKGFTISDILASVKKKKK